MSSRRDFVKASQEDNDGVTDLSTINKINVVKESVVRMMNEGKELKEIMDFLDKAIEDMDKEIATVQVMCNVANKAVKFQTGIDISAAGNSTGYNVQDNRKDGPAAAKAQESESEGSSSSSGTPADNPPSTT